jgi:hypothetical protein
MLRPPLQEFEAPLHAGRFKGLGEAADFFEFLGPRDLDD